MIGRVVLASLAAATLAAGCGATAKTYDASSTQTCLRSHGLQVSGADADYIAQAATNGGFAITVGGTIVNVSFYRNHGDANDGVDAYRTVGEVSDAKLYATGNAVFSWDDTPLPSEKSAVDGCLAS